MSTETYENLRKELARREVDCLLLISGPSLYDRNNFGYATGFFYEWGWEFLNVAVLPVEKEPFMLCRGIVIPPAKRYSWIKDIKIYKSVDNLTEFDAETSKENLINVLLSALDERGLTSSRLGLNYISIPVEWYQRLKEKLPNAKFKDCSLLLEKMRFVKTDEEIRRIRIATKLCDEGVLATFKACKVGAWENDVTEAGDRRIHSYAREHYPNYLVRIFLSGTKSGEKTWQIGPSRGAPPRRLMKGDCIEHNRGTHFGNYYGETERVFFLGEADEKQRKMYKAALESQTAGIEAIRPGVEAQEIDRVCHKVLKKYEYEKYMIPFIRVGHGVGIEAHEWGPNLLEGNETKLQPGMVVTVEPGIYVPKVGCARLASTVLVTEDGHEELSKAPKDLESIIVPI